MQLLLQKNHNKKTCPLKRRIGLSQDNEYKETQKKTYDNEISDNETNDSDIRDNETNILI